jgi:hypothetical protein
MAAFNAIVVEGAAGRDRRARQNSGGQPSISSSRKIEASKNLQARAIRRIGCRPRIGRSAAGSALLGSG